MVDAAGSDLLHREAVAAGLRRDAPVDHHAVARRRRQLGLLAALVAAGAATVVGLMTAAPGAGGALHDVSGQTLGGVIALVVGFALYGIEKEVHLRRLETLLTAERAHAEEMSTQLDALGALLRAGRAVNSALELDEVLDTILGTALEMFSGASGSILLSDGSGELVAASAEGNDDAARARTRLGAGVAGRVALTRQPVLLDGSVSPADFPGYRPRRSRIHSAMVVPLVHRDTLVGVLNVTASRGTTFTHADLDLLSLFAEHAASGIAHGRVHEEERRRVDEMVRLEQLKTEFITGVSHDLRTPLTSIVGCTSAARRPGVSTAQRDELLAIAEAQAGRLTTMVERLLTSAELGVDPQPAHVTPFDAAYVTTRAVWEHQAAGRQVELEETAPSYAIGDADRLREALDLLVENAFRHGAGPVRIAVTQSGDRVVVSVCDRGPGIPAAQRERVFERFVRLDASRGTAGVGLGLSIARAVVTAMGGTVTAGEAEGGGARLDISLVAAPPRTLPVQRGTGAAVAS